MDRRYLTRASLVDRHNSAYDRLAFVEEHYEDLCKMYDTIMEHLKIPVGDSSSGIKIIKNIQTMPVARIDLTDVESTTEEFVGYDGSNNEPIFINVTTTINLGYNLDDPEERDLLSQNIVSKCQFYLSGDHTFTDYYKFFGRWAYISKENLVPGVPESPVHYFLIVPIPSQLVDGAYKYNDSVSVNLTLFRKDHSTISLTGISAGETHNLQNINLLYGSNPEHVVEERAVYMGD